MRLKTIILLVTITALALGVAVAWPRISFYMLTGHFSPIYRVVTLQNPVPVTTWNPDGLYLSDGRMVQLPGLHLLPSDSLALAEVTKRGVEVDADGRVWGLVRVHHWCGNDPVREHIARVDVADVMTFLRVGESVRTVPFEEFLVREPGGSFSEWGWEVGEFVHFLTWENLKNAAR